MKISSYTEICKIDSMTGHETEGFLVLFQEYSDVGLIVTVTNKKMSEKREISIKELWKLLSNNKVKGDNRMKTKLFAVRIAPNGSIQGDYLAVVEAKSLKEAEELVDKIDTADMDEFVMDFSETVREIKKTGITRIIVIGGYED